MARPEVPADILAAIEALLESLGDDVELRNSADEMKKLLCEKYGIKKFCKGGVLS